MVALLTCMYAAPPNGFRLWDATAFVRLGSEPNAPAALAMAQGLHAAHTAQWPVEAAQAASPQWLVEALARSAQGEATSPRPALLAYLLGLMGDARSAAAPVQARALALQRPAG